MAIGGAKMGLGVIRGLIADAQYRGDSAEALSFAGILMTYLQESSPEEALIMAERWKREAGGIGDEVYTNGLQTSHIRKVSFPPLSSQMTSFGSMRS